MSARSTCILVLSTKSAGSSAVQELLREHGGGQHVEHTRHAEHETLFWTKAASVLGKHQIKIPDSEVPIPAKKAAEDLRRLLLDNVPGYSPPSNSSDLIFHGWRALCERYSPLFVEKSPHHLHEWAALELILEAEQRMPDIDFRYVGLVRNPMDAFYSMWSRRRDDLGAYQLHWRMAYENLLRVQQRVSDRLIIVRYEDLSPPGGAVNELFGFLGRTPSDEAQSFIHAQSRKRWRNDRWFGLQLDFEVMRLAQQLGYTAEELENKTYPLWPAYQKISRIDPRFWGARLRNMRRRVRNAY